MGRAAALGGKAEQGCVCRGEEAGLDDTGSRGTCASGIRSEASIFTTVWDDFESGVEEGGAGGLCAVSDIS